jgi:hypothetical protein
MTNLQFGIFAMVWPFLSIGLAVAGVFAVHRYLDRRERRQHAAE